MATTDLRDLPNYLPQEAAHYLKVSVPTIRAWATGQERGPAATRRRSRPLFCAARQQPLTLSFMNLVEVYVLASIRREHRVPMPRVRAALDYVTRVRDIARPLIEQQFLTDGLDLFVEQMESTAAFVNASQRGQLAMKPLLQTLLKRIDRDAQGLARCFSPWRRSPDEARTVEIDPTRGFGRLVIAGTGIATEVLAERWQAGESMEELAQDYRLDLTRVEEGLRWETNGRAA